MQKFDMGIIGGGQLALMIIEECKKRGLTTACLDQDPHAPAFALCDKKVVGSFSDEQALKTLLQCSTVTTYEFENINCDLVKSLSKEFNIPQGERPLHFSRHRLTEKTLAKNHGLNPPKFLKIDSLSDIEQGVEEMGKCVLKTCTLGYDGKGQMVLANGDDLSKIPKPLTSGSILEEFISFDYETSCILVRDSERVVSLPMCENIHKKGILDITLSHSPKLSPKVLKEITEKSKQFMIECDFLGILAIEFFVKGDKFYFNEMAPRPHNSGHHSIESCDKSQFGLLVDFLTNEKLVAPKLLHPCIMKNILGQDVKNVSKIPNENAFLHMYGKTEARLNRKMGHITFLNTDREEFFTSINTIFEE